MEYTLFFDGACNPNPGKGGCGATLYANKIEIWCNCKYIGEQETNNTTEYNGLILGLTEVENRGIKKIIVKGDSQLVIYQLTDKYKVNNSNLLKLYNCVKTIEKTGIDIEYIHVPRNENKRADELSKIALHIESHKPFN